MRDGRRSCQIFKNYLKGREIETEAGNLLTCLLFKNVFERERERDRESAGARSFTRHTFATKTGHAEARNSALLESVRWLGPTCLTHCLLSPRVYAIRKLDGNQGRKDPIQGT